MSSCLYGSQKKTSAPSSFSVDSGAICFVLGLDNVICPLLDKIPSVIGKPWKEIIQTVAKDGLGLAVDVITGQIDTSSFCSSPAPALPSDITYADIFNFIASYVPPFSIVASGDDLLGKISKYYLYEKWYVHCECKKKEPLPKPDAPPTIPPFVGACSASQSRASQLNNLINETNGNNAVGGEFIYSWWLGTIYSAPANQISEAQYNATKNSLLTDSDLEILSVSSDNSGRNMIGDNYTFGCLKARGVGGDSTFYYTQWRFRRISTQQIFDRYLGYDMRHLRTLTWDETGCCPPPVPPPPVLPPPPQNCVPVPPPRYCELFPDDPMCANVPANPCATSPTSIQVVDYDCVGLSISKTVLWNL